MVYKSCGFDASHLVNLEKLYVKQLDDSIPYEDYWTQLRESYRDHKKLQRLMVVDREGDADEQLLIPRLAWQWNDENRVDNKLDEMLDSGLLHREWKDFYGKSV